MVHLLVKGQTYLKTKKLSLLCSGCASGKIEKILEFFLILARYVQEERLKGQEKEKH